MGLDVDLHCENNFQAEPRPKIVHPSLRSRSKLERDIKGQHSRKYYHLKSLDGGFEELSPHRKSMPSRTFRVNMEDNLVVKRGSMYQSSSEVRRMRQLKEGRTEESSYSDEAFLSFEIVDSLPRARRRDAVLDSQQKRSPLGFLTVEPKSPSVDTVQLIPKKSVDFPGLSFRDLPENQPNENQPNLSRSLSGCVSAEKSPACELVEKGSIEEARSTCNQMPLHKSFSEKVGMINSPSLPEREILKASPKTRFSPLKRMLDPIMKSKSQRNPSSMKAETADRIATDAADIIRNGVFCKSLVDDFSKYDRQLIASDQVLTTSSSPAHLHAVLKLEFKNGAPSFEFSVKDPEDIISAKTWRTDSAFNWMYTFHSRKSSRGPKDRNGSLSPVVGQMQVSCYLCSEVSENGSLDNYMATEFVLYDIAQARRSFAIEERSYCPSETNNSTETQKYQHSVRRTSSDCDSDPSTSHPWSLEDLHPHLEIAAIVIQIPFKKDKLRDATMKETKSNSLNPAAVKVVIPRGAHGLPNTEENGPSSLFDRLRFGGGCDCGGWDMSCPIIVFDNPCSDDLMDYSTKGSQQPSVLFIQGRKEKVPALSMTSDGKGQYSVDFHAQLSAIQAFSICIAILHSSEASSAFGQENRHRLYSNSLELLLEEEVRHLIEAVTEEKKRKAKKRVEKRPPSFFLDRPFSPMGRV